MATQALIPQFNLAPQLDKERQERLAQALAEGTDKPSDTDKAIAALANSPGWKAVQNYLTRELDQMNALIQEAISSGAGFDEIGQRTTVVALIGEEFKSVIDFVEGKRQYVANAGDE